MVVAPVETRDSNNQYSVQLHTSVNGVEGCNPISRNGISNSMNQINQ